MLALDEFRTLGIDSVSRQEALDTSTPMGEAMFAICAAMAQLERRIIQELVVAGLEHAKAKGTKSGAPIGRPRALFDRSQVVQRRAAGESWRDIAVALGVGTGTVRRAFYSVPKPPSTQRVAASASQRFMSA